MHLFWQRRWPQGHCALGLISQAVPHRCVASSRSRSAHRWRRLERPPRPLFPLSFPTPRSPRFFPQLISSPTFSFVFWMPAYVFRCVGPPRPSPSVCTPMGVRRRRAGNHFSEPTSDLATDQRETQNGTLHLQTLSPVLKCRKTFHPAILCFRRTVSIGFGCRITLGGGFMFAFMF